MSGFGEVSSIRPSNSVSGGGEVSGKVKLYSEEKQALLSIIEAMSSHGLEEPELLCALFLKRLNLDFVCSEFNGF